MRRRAHSFQLTKRPTVMDDTIGTVPRPLDATGKRPNEAMIRKLIMEDCMTSLNGKFVVSTDANPDSIEMASKICTGITGIEVCTSSAECLSGISKFSGIRQLTLRAPTDVVNPFQRYVVTLLTKFDLEELTLVSFSDVCFSAIAEHCRNLTSLNLIVCVMYQDSAVGEGFPKLKELRVGYLNRRTLLRLLPVCGNLVSLHLDGTAACAAFLRCAPAVSMQKLERLTLGTNECLDRLSGVEHLRQMVAALPSLRSVATDSYGIRLFIQNYAPHVGLAWVNCTICAAEFPNMSQNHRNRWLLSSSYTLR